MAIHTLRLLGMATISDNSWLKQIIVPRISKIHFDRTPLHNQRQQFNMTQLKGINKQTWVAFFSALIAQPVTLVLKDHFSGCSSYSHKPRVAPNFCCLYSLGRGGQCCVVVLRNFWKSLSECSVSIINNKASSGVTGTSPEEPPKKAKLSGD